MQVRETIVHFFETFSRVGSASQTVKAFRQEGILFPSRLHDSQTVFRPLTTSTAMRVLHNPRYAGAYAYAYAYAYGRRRYRRTIDGKRNVREQDNDDWTACIPDAHPGYISWGIMADEVKRNR
ncbi:recombinase family protein [Ensifer sp. LC54]|uniref:recombinase family protein n=1 Tax=Ensifer sp. LC54 TaxID=1873715 RepID=UPI001FCDA4F8|nr:recombinase family protein [Ensifer sp. LC54]